MANTTIKDLTSVEDRYKKYSNLYSTQKNNAVNTVNTNAQAEADAVSSVYEGQIDTTKHEYEDVYRQNAVQKYLNEKQIAESMANNGITDSGLNRTQQTANQLSYANNRVKIDTKLQDAVNSIRDIMSSKLAEIESNRASQVSSIEQSYDNAAMSAAQEEYNTEYQAEVDRINSELEAENKAKELENEYNLATYKAKLENETALSKAQISAELARYKAGLSASTKSSSDSGNSKTTNLINTDNQLIDRSALKGSFESNGIQVTTSGAYDKEDKQYDDGTKITYLDTVTGKKLTLNYNQSPFVSGKNNVNPDTVNGVFSNGYQPDNVGGQKLKATGQKLEDGQNIWTYKTESGKTRYAVWDGSTNKYDTYTAKQINAELGTNYPT